MARKLDPVKEHERLEALRVYEREYGMYGLIAGVDEAGRGPLAGPVVAAAVILPPDTDIFYLNDSKKVPEKRRELLFDEIREDLENDKDADGGTYLAYGFTGMIGGLFGGVIIMV